MGKSKKRTLYKNNNENFLNMTRSEAIQTAINFLNTGDKDAYSIITLFGLSAEEILEGGASYEIVKGLGNILK